MKSTLTPHTHTALTATEIKTTFSSPGAFQYDVTIPKNTLCTKLDGGDGSWVVSDLSFIADKRGFLYSDADNYGIRVKEDQLVDILPKGAVRIAAPSEPANPIESETEDEIDGQSDNDAPGR